MAILIAHKDSTGETMILDDNTPQKPKIEYPTQWGFKLIGRDKEALLACIKEAMGEKESVVRVAGHS